MRHIIKRRQTLLRRFRRRSGFVLIEALVAFAILTLSLAALFSGVFGATRNEDRAEFQLRAARLATTQFAVLGVSTPVQPGATQGKSEDGLGWMLTIEMLPEPPAAPLPGARTIGFWAHITVSRDANMSGLAERLTFDIAKTATVGGQP